MPSSFAIGDHFEKLIDSLVESGRYNSRSEVVREGLRMIEDREEGKKLALQQIAAAFADGEASGEYMPMDEAFEEIYARLESHPRAAAE